MHVYACVCHMCIIIVCVCILRVCALGYMYMHTHGCPCIVCVCVHAGVCVYMGVLLCTNYSVQDHFTCNIKSIANSLCLASVI